MSTRTKRFTTVLAVAVLAMAMYGCSSSDDGSGISQDMYDALKAENDTLTTDNGTLTTDNETLTTDNETLTTDNETLTTDNETLKGRGPRSGQPEAAGFTWAWYRRVRNGDGPPGGDR